MPKQLMHSSAFAYSRTVKPCPAFLLLGLIKANYISAVGLLQALGSPKTGGGIALSLALCYDSGDGIKRTGWQVVQDHFACPTFPRSQGWRQVHGEERAEVFIRSTWLLNKLFCVTVSHVHAHNLSYISLSVQTTESLWAKNHIVVTRRHIERRQTTCHTLTRLCLLQLPTFTRS